jgi:nucleotide-binding universal stress UspA family protein
MDIRRILVATDFSDGALAALHAAASLAERLGASIEALHVVTDSTAEAEARTRMGEFLGSLEATHGSVRARGRVEQGTPAPRILATAARDDFDLIVMGTLGWRGLARARLGSVAEQVVMRAPCPVLTVRVRSAAQVAEGSG